MLSARILRRALLKNQLQRQLHDPGIPCAIDLAEQAAAESGAREGIEVRVVQHVEGFRPELEADPLSEICVLAQVCIPAEEARTVGCRLTSQSRWLPAKENRAL